MSAPTVELTTEQINLLAADVRKRLAQDDFENEEHRNERGPMPFVPFVSRAPLSTERIREIANDIRARQGLPPLP